MGDPEFGRPVEVFDALPVEGEAATRTSETLRTSIGASIQSISTHKPTTFCARLLLRDSNSRCRKASVSAVSATLEVGHLCGVVAVLLKSE